MAAGALYDLFAFFRRKTGKALGIFLDIAYFLCVSGLCFAALALGGEKSLRFYALLGIFCGAGIYSLGIRRAVIGIARVFSR